MKKPMKFKRYEGGGEIADKESGLKASKGDDVGFFQRLRMGNIDDPSSEAYKRFGAGASQLTPRKVSIGDAAYEDDRLQKRAMERSRLMQQDISAGSDFKGRPQDEGYRPNEGTAKERAMLEGARDYGKITESGDQGSGGPGSSRVVKAPTKAAPKPSTKLIDPSNIKSGRRFDDEGLIDPSNIKSGRREFEESQKKPVDETKLSLSERMKLSRDRSKSGSGPTDKRSVNERVRSTFGMKSGGSVSSASRRADGIATKGKTRGRMC
jgi:hypothetical protein